MEQSSLNSAFYRVGLVADQTWWTEKDFSDEYKLASLSLWNKMIESNLGMSNWGQNQEPVTCEQNNNVEAKLNERQNTAAPQLILKKDKLKPTCRMKVTLMQKELVTLDPTILAPLPQGVLTDTKRILSANWPKVLLRKYPALNTLKNNKPSFFNNKHVVRSTFIDWNTTLPYSVESIDEFEYLKKIASRTIKNVWPEDAETQIAETAFEKPVWEPRLNANVPEFYPSVLLPPRQCPPRYSNVFGANYQSEVFPYNDEKDVEKKETVFEESVKRKKINCRGFLEQRLPHQFQGETGSAAVSSSSPNLSRSPQTCDSSSRTHGRESPPVEVNYWLQKVYPYRVLELAKFRTIARHIDAVTQRIALPFPQIVTQPSPAAGQFTPSSERRLYRDVLARKTEDAVDRNKDESEQNPFDELERQALEQYQSSETCLVQQGHGNVINPDPEDSKFQDLEREALEQYTEDGDDQIERSPETPIISDINAFVRDSESAFENTGDINLNQFILLNLSNDGNNTGKTDLSAADETSISPESIVRSVVGDDESNDEIIGLPQANEELGDAYIEFLDMLEKNKNRAKKNMKRGTTRHWDEENKFGSYKLHHDKLSSVNNDLFYQIPNVLNIEEETRCLATNLKHKVLNYLRSVDLEKIKELDENRRPSLKPQVSKDHIERPIQERVKVSDIDDLDTYRSYIREISTKARSTLLSQFKRIRSEIMESTSRGIVPLVIPTTSEKRRVRKIIKKCLELKNHTVKTPRKSMKGVKREVMDTLEIVHSTMEVIHALSNLSKEAFKDVEFLKSGRTLAAELYVERTTLEDKSDYIKHRVMVDERSVLLVVLFPRIPGVLYDRGHEEFKKPNCRSIYYDHDLLRINYANLFKNFPKPNEFQVPKMDYFYWLPELTVHNIFKVKFSRGSGILAQKSTALLTTENSTQRLKRLLPTPSFTQKPPTVRKRSISAVSINSTTDQAASVSMVTILERQNVSIRV